MKRRYIIKTLSISLILLFFIGIKFTNAQTIWSLDECINHAINNNITIKQQALEIASNDIALKQSKFNILPNLNAGTSYDFSFGKTLNYDNTYIDQNSQNVSFYVNSSVDLFNGLSKYNTIKKYEFEREASLLNLSKAKEDISLAVVSAYLEILFNKEILNNAVNQTAITKKQIALNTELVEAGSLAGGTLLENRSQLADEELAVANYENQLAVSLLNLQQLLELSYSQDFDIAEPDITNLLINTNTPLYTDVYNNALLLRPGVLSMEYKLKSLDQDIKIAKSSLYPSLSLGFSYYNNYNNSFKDVNGNTIQFYDQWNINDRKQLGLTLNIPIFNGLTAKSQVDYAKISYQNTEYQLQIAKNTLLKEIQQAYISVENAKNKYEASQKAVESAEESFRYVEEKYNLGLLSSLEYNQAKNKVSNAKSQMIQAKYEFIFNSKILEFYGR